MTTLYDLTVKVTKQFLFKKPNGIPIERTTDSPGIREWFEAIQPILNEYECDLDNVNSVEYVQISSDDYVAVDYAWDENGSLTIRIPVYVLKESDPVLAARKHVLENKCANIRTNISYTEFDKKLLVSKLEICNKRLQEETNELSQLEDQLKDLEKREIS